MDYNKYYFKACIVFIILLFGCSKDEAVEVIPECPTDQIYTEDKGCHIPNSCERIELDLYRDNGQLGCFVTYKVEPYSEIEKGCIKLIDHQKKLDAIRCEQIMIGYGFKWTANQKCEC